MIDFPITRYGIPLADFKISDVTPTGMDFESIPGSVPMYHEILACNAANYRYFHDWQELTPEQQSILLAHYFSVILVGNNSQDAENRRMKAESKRK